MRVLLCTSFVSPPSVGCCSAPFVRRALASAAKISSSLFACSDAGVSCVVELESPVKRGPVPHSSAAESSRGLDVTFGLSLRDSFPTSFSSSSFELFPSFASAFSSTLTGTMTSKCSFASMSAAVTKYASKKSSIRLIARSCLACLRKPSASSTTLILMPWRAPSITVARTEILLKHPQTYISVMSLALSVRSRFVPRKAE